MHLTPWDLGAPGRGFLVRSEQGEVGLLLWEVGSVGRPMHADVVDSEAVGSSEVLASLLIEPDGRASVIPWGTGADIDCVATVVALDDRLQEIPELLDELWDFE